MQQRTPFRLPWALAFVVLAGCAGGGESGPDRPRVERTTEGGVTTVRNLGDGVWEGPARLEAIGTIGDRAGQEYQLAMPFSIAANDEMVVVGDLQLGEARSYTRDGRFLTKYGRVGQGPGEYEDLLGVGLMPDGRVVVQGFPTLLFFEPDGELVDSWTVPVGGEGFGISGAGAVFTPDGRVLWQVFPLRPGEARPSPETIAYRDLSAAGWGDAVVFDLPDYEPAMLTFPCTNSPGDCRYGIPFAARFSVVMGPDGSFYSGVTEEYRVTVRRLDGTTLVVEREVEPVAVSAIERDLNHRSLLVGLQRNGVDLSPEASIIPAVKPAYVTVIPARDGGFFVAREGKGSWDDTCGAPSDWQGEPLLSECLRSTYFIDVFAADGTYQGYFPRPDEMRIQRAHVEGDEFWTYAEDEEGTALVRGYRIVPPVPR